MSRLSACPTCGAVGFPRVSGDEPPTLPAPPTFNKFSPRERG